MDGRVDVLDLAPVDARLAAAADPTGETSDPARPSAPVTGPDEQRHDLRFLAGAALDRKVVDVAAATAGWVEQLVVHQMEADVELAAYQFCPAFVRIINGIADSETAMITIR